MRRPLFALALLSGLAVSALAPPAKAAPVAHGLAPAVALLSGQGALDPAVLTEGTTAQPVRYYRYRRYGYAQRYYRPRYYRRY